MNENPNQVTMMTGDKCETDGLYWSSGSGHAHVLNFLENDQFPHCPTCSHQIKWILTTQYADKNA
jgi:hypothetical protein